MHSRFILSTAVLTATALFLSACAGVSTPTAAPEAPAPASDVADETQPDAPADATERTDSPDGSLTDTEANRSKTTDNQDTTTTPDSETDSETEKLMTSPVDVASVDIRTDITYTTASTTNGDIPLALDLYMPVDEDGNDLITNRPAVVLVHGGGFILGSKDYGPIGTWARELAAAGYPTAAINYRLILSDPTVTTPELIGYLQQAQPTADLPDEAPSQALAALRIGLGAAMEDTTAAMNYLIDMGAHPDSIAVGGASAGAITAIHLGYLNNDLELPWPRPAAVLNLWGSFSTATGSPESGIDANDPALWTLHGTNDRTVEYASAEYLDEQTAAAGVPHTLHPIIGAGHGFAATGFLTDTVPDSDTRYLDDQIAFLNRHLLDQ